MLVQICSSYEYMRDAGRGWVVEWDRVNDRGIVLTYECLVVKTPFRSRTTWKQTCLITAGIVIKDSLMIKNLGTQSLLKRNYLYKKNLPFLKYVLPEVYAQFIQVNAWLLLFISSFQNTFVE